MNEARFAELKELLMEQLERKPSADDAAIRGMIDHLILTDRGRPLLTLDERVEMSRELFYSVRRLDILQDLLDDGTVTEIMVNGPDSIYIERGGKISRWERHFSSREKLEDVVQQIVGSCNRVVNESHPIADARLPDGSRVNAVIAPVALDGPILTIRKFPEEAITMEKLVRYGALSPEAADFLKELVDCRYSMIIGGGTSAGKTTFLNALSNYIPSDERIITIEDNAELQIQGISNLVRLEAKEANHEDMQPVTIRDLIKSALRMRPDRIIVGEVRSGEAVDMLQAYNTGHDGSLCTVHCNSTADMLSRLEMMTLFAVSLPLPAIRRQIAQGVEILIHLGRLRDGTRRVLEISEVDGMEGQDIMTHALFRWDVESESLLRCGELKNRRKLKVNAPVSPEDESASGKAETGSPRR